MSDDHIELTRRKILGSVGAVGVAGAAAGFGTSALFSDEESFVNNSITAGELDLLMDWEEHYSYPQVYGFDDPTTNAQGDDLRVTRTDPAEDDSRAEANYVGLPDPEHPVVWVHREDFNAYFQNTTIEAYPDAEGDPVEANFNATQPCELLANVPGDLGTYNDAVDGPARTRNDDTYDSENDQPLPLVHLTDVKPGDYGEFTFSAHLCYNDGYLWMRMPGGLTESENGLTEPESEVDQTPGEGELAENIQTTVWYDDDCSNTINGEPEPVSAMALIDTSGSVDSSEMQIIEQASNAFVEQLNQQANTDIEAGVMTFSGDDAGLGADVVLQNDVEDISNYVDSNGDGVFDAGSNLLPSEGNGQTPLAPALDLAREVLNDRAQYARKTILVISDGQPTSPSFERYGVVDPSGNDVTAQSNGVTNAPDGQFLSDVFNGTPDGTLDSTSIQDEALLVARDIDTGPRTDDGFTNPDDDPDISGSDGITLRTVGVGTQNQSDLNDFLSTLATRPGLFYNSSLTQDLVDLTSEIINDLNVVTGEKVIFRGTLEELAAEMPVALDGNPMDTSARQPFDASSTHCFGLAWWVPAEVGNEIQSDSVNFDLGFYAEQARNNDNPGQTFGNT